MCDPTITVWFVCRLCRGSFEQVDAFIEHKKEKHFTQFQNTTCIVFEEGQQGPLYPVITSDGDHQLAEEINEQPIKVETNDNDTVIPFSSEIIDEPNLDLVEPKSELITYECEIKTDDENCFFGLEQPEHNPYVLLKRLTSDEIQRAAVRQLHYTLLKCEQKNLEKRPVARYSFDTSSKISDHSEVEKCTGILPTANVRISTEHGLQFECKLCSKQLESDAELKIHVGICALYHKHRHRFCVTCNRKFSGKHKLKDHRVRFHGTEEEKLSLFKFKCHVCPKQYREAAHLRLHLESHKKKKQRKVKISQSKPLKCSHLNCETEFWSNSALQRHISAVHFGVRPFSCSFRNCNKTFSIRHNLKRHFLIHTGERPFKCTVDNCNKAFTTSGNRSLHQIVHFNL